MTGMWETVAEQRLLIQQALAVVDEVTPHPTTPDTPSAFDAWPVLLDIRPTTICLVEIDWQVFLALPSGDQGSTVETGDALMDPVCNALMTIGKVTHVRPARWITGDAGEGIPVWQFEITI